jgi:hypothetical protein
MFLQNVCLLKKNVWDVMINHLQTRVQIELDMEEE